MSSLSGETWQSFCKRDFQSLDSCLLFRYFSSHPDQSKMFCKWKDLAALWKFEKSAPWKCLSPTVSNKTDFTFARHFIYLFLFCFLDVFLSQYAMCYRDLSFIINKCGTAIQWKYIFFFINIRLCLFFSLNLKSTVRRIKNLYNSDKPSVVFRDFCSVATMWTHSCVFQQSVRPTQPSHITALGPNHIHCWQILICLDLFLPHVDVTHSDTHIHTCTPVIVCIVLPFGKRLHFFFFFYSAEALSEAENRHWPIC